MKLHRYISGLLIAAIATASLATKIEVSQINGFNEAVQQQITLYGVPVTRSINSGAGLTGGGDLSANRTLAIDYTHTGTWSGPQTFSGGLSGALTGNASTASHLATSRTFSYTGDATGGPTSFDGSANISTALALASVGTAGTYGDATHVPQFTTDAKGRVTGVTAVAISGIPASSAVKLTTARNFSITGDVATSSACSFDGTADCTLNVAMASTVAGAHTFSGALTASGGVTGNLTGNVTGNVSGLAGTATALANPQTIGTLTGDATSAGSAFDGTASNANALTLATVNSNVGSFGDATDVATFTVNAKGLITAAGSTPITFPSLAGYATLAGTQTFTGTDTFSNPIVGSVTGSSGSTTGNAATATALATARTVAIQTGDVTSPGASFNGTGNETAATTLITTQTGAHTWSAKQTFATPTTGLASINLPNGTAPTSPATGDIYATTSGLFYRDASTINTLAYLTSSITGNAATATKLATGRTLAITGDLAWTSPTFDGSGNITAAGTLATVATGATCGDATHVAVVTFNAKGLTTACTATSISGVPASTANTLATPRLIGTLTGDVTTAGSNFDGSANNTNATVLATNQTASHGWSGTQAYSNTVTISDPTVGGAVPQLRLSNISTATNNNAAGISFDPRNAGVNSRDAQIVGRTPSASSFSELVFRTGSGTNASPSDQWIMSAGLFYQSLTDPGVGNIAANSFIGALTGNSTTASALASAQTIGVLTGDITSSGSTFNGSATNTNATILATTQSAVHTWSALQTFSGGLTSSGANTFVNSGSNFVIGGSQNMSWDSTGRPTLRYDAASAGAVGLTINNYGITATDQGGYFGIASFGTGGTFGMQAGAINVLSTDTWAASGNRSARMIFNLANAGSTTQAFILAPTAATFNGTIIGTAITASTGNITATAGNIVATAGNVTTVGLTASGTVGLNGTTNINTGGTFNIGSGATFNINDAPTFANGANFNGTSGVIFQNTGSNFTIGGVTSANRFATWNNFGLATYRYDNNGGGPSLGILQNFAVTAAAMGGDIATVQLGTGGTLGAQAGRLSIFSTDTWALAANRSSEIHVDLINGGTAVSKAWQVDPQLGELVMSRLVHGTADNPVGITTVSADANYTYVAGTSLATVLLSATITANRTVTLPACVTGDKIRFIHEGIGAFTWTIASKAVALNSWIDVECSGTSYIETASGAL